MSARLRLLGPPRFEVDGTVTDLPVDRPASLGYYLARRGDWVRRDELAYLYYPDADESLAASNLRKLIHRLKAQPWAAALETDQTRIRLYLPSDLNDFQMAIAHKNFARALEVHAGSFLEGLTFPDLAGFEAWLELERQDLMRDWRSAALEHARTLEGQRQAAEAERWLVKVLRADPLDEEAVQALLRVLIASGEHVRAQEEFERFKTDLARELDSEPLEATRALIGGTQPRQQSVSTHNLPALTKRLIGRQRELARLAALLEAGGPRLITVLGLGGIGKTRLALELAWAQLGRFADGVWLVPLAGVGSASQLPSAIANALGLTLSGQHNEQTQLQHFLGAKHLLVVLDNFEHMVEGAGAVESLLEAVPGLQVLVTSRVPLELPAEHLMDLDGLPYPPALSRDDPESFDAVKLFLERAVRVASDFTITPPALQAIAEISRKVQGMPLALELAATWVRSLSPQEIAQALEQDLTLLASPGRDLPERHRSIETVFAYSWARLSSLEQGVLAGLTVFRGGFTLTAATAVAGAHLPMLLSLMNQLLVRRGEDGRFDLHELVRQWVMAQLTEAQRAQLEDRYCEHFVDFLRSRSEATSWEAQRRAFDKVRQDLANVLHCLALIAERRWDLLEAIASQVQRLFEELSLYESGANVLKAVVAKVRARATLEDQHGLFCGRLLAILAYFLSKSGDMNAAKEAAGEAMRLLSERHDFEFLGLAVAAMGMAHHHEGKLELALEEYTQARDICNQSTNKRGLALCHNRIGVLLWGQGKLEESAASHRQAIASAHWLNERSEVANAYNSIGISLESSGRIEEAIEHYRKSLHIHQENGYLRGQSAALTNLGHVHERIGDLEAARQYYEDSIAIKDTIGDPVITAVSLTNLADVHYALGDEVIGHRINHRALELTRKAGATLYVMRVLWSFARQLAASGHTEDALYLTHFLAVFPDAEAWVREEASAEIPKLEAHLEPTRAETLKAGQHQPVVAMLDWLTSNAGVGSA